MRSIRLLVQNHPVKTIQQNRHLQSVFATCTWDLAHDSAHHKLTDSFLNHLRLLFFKAQVMFISLLIYTASYICYLQYFSGWAVFIKNRAVRRGIEPLFSPWEGDVLTAWPTNHNNRYYTETSVCCQHFFCNFLVFLYNSIKYIQLYKYISIHLFPAVKSFNMIPQPESKWYFLSDN